MGTYVVVALLSLGVFAAYGDRATVGSVEQALGTFALLVAYGAAVIPLAYCYSFSFSSPSAAQARPQMLFLNTKQRPGASIIHTGNLLGPDRTAPCSTASLHDNLLLKAPRNSLWRFCSPLQHGTRKSLLGRVVAKLFAALSPGKAVLPMVSSMAVCLLALWLERLSAFMRDHCKHIANALKPVMFFV